MTTTTYHKEGGSRKVDSPPLTPLASSKIIRWMAKGEKQFNFSIKKLGHTVASCSKDVHSPGD